MRKARPLAFARPPIWELGISAIFGGPVVNMYDIKDIHDIFRSRFPTPERQPAMASFPPFPSLGVPLQPQVFISQGNETRWWFVSESGTDVVQVQDSFISRNWRRLVPPPADTAQYPGFDAVFADFQQIVGSLERSFEGAGRSLPEPSWIELMYDNLIPLESADGTAIRFSEVLKPLKFDPPLAAGGLHLTWFEFVDPEGDKSQFDMQVEIAQAGVAALPSPTKVKSFAKLTFRARRKVPSWGAAYEFLDVAHAVMRDRLVELTSDATRATWGQA